MLNFGMWEILVVLTLALVVVGPERLPSMVRFLGRQYGKLMRASQELRRAFLLEADRTESQERVEELRKRREAARRRLEERQKAEQSEEGVEGPVSMGEGTYVPFDHKPTDSAPETDTSPAETGPSPSTTEAED